VARRRLLVWLALAGGVLLLAGALLFIRVPVLTVADARAGRPLFSTRVGVGERFVLSYRHSVTQDVVSGTFQVEADGTLSVKETVFRSPGPGLPELLPGEEYEISGGMIRHRAAGTRLRELSFFVHPFTEHRLEAKATRLDLSRDLPPGSLVRVRLERVRASRWLFGAGQES
jgi:hypothetical protein